MGVSLLFSLISLLTLFIPGSSAAIMDGASKRLTITRAMDAVEMFISFIYLPMVL